MATIRDRMEAKGFDTEPYIHELAIAQQLIRERKGPLDLVRELLSNAGAREVGATEITITYTKNEKGHVFTVKDNGVGMDYRDDPLIPGRMDKFLGLGLSEISGIKGDEFSWKGLGSKLSFQSRRVEIETHYQGGNYITAFINEPWESIEKLKKPKTKISVYEADEDDEPGTTVTVIGHPPHSKDEPYSFERIKNYLQHRTFVGFTKPRDNPPRIILSVLGRTEEIPFGFPELEYLEQEFDEGTVRIDIPDQRKNISGTSNGILVRMKGFYTWDDKKYDLGSKYLNTGMILSVKGIPYFTLNMRELGSGGLAVSNPGEGKCCIIVECDEVQKVMNISRSALVDDPLTDLFKETVTKMISKLEHDDEHLRFRQVPKRRKTRVKADVLEERKAQMERSQQMYVVHTEEGQKPLLLGIEPKQEGDVVNILIKLEALNKLPFKKFQTIHYSASGPDLITHFRETETSDTEKYAVVELERLFTNYKLHEHHPPQFPKVVCWDIGKSPKVRVEDTDVTYKKKVVVDGTEVAVYLISKMPGIAVRTKAKLEEMKVL